MIARGRRMPRKRPERLGERGQASGPLVTGTAVEPHLAVVLDDLEAVAVELRLMQPGAVLRDGLGGRGEARSDELRRHAAALRLLGICRQPGYVEIGVEGDLLIRESSAIGAIRRCRINVRVHSKSTVASKELVGVLEPEGAHLLAQDVDTTTHHSSSRGTVESLRALSRHANGSLIADLSSLASRIRSGLCRQRPLRPDCRRRQGSRRGAHFVHLGRSAISGRVSQSAAPRRCRRAQRRPPRAVVAFSCEHHQPSRLSSCGEAHHDSRHGLASHTQGRRLDAGPSCDAGQALTDG